MASPATSEQIGGGPAKATAYGWLVFALSFGLLISDYMARQVLNAVFPLLKAEWALSDSQLGLLSGVVAAMVGLLTFPLSLAADRWGRVRSLAIMAVLWSIATLLCAAAPNFQQMLLGRALVGVGEAAYGSVGIAVVISVFPRHMRGTLSAAFMAGGVFGQVLGVAVGAEIAAREGWRAAFFVIGIFGLALGLLYPLLVRERRIAAITELGAAEKGGLSLRGLVSTPAVCFAYVGSGLQLFAAGALPAWLPSFFNRYYQLPIDRAGRFAAALLLVCGCGMILCGMLSDRLAKSGPSRNVSLAIAYSLGSALCLAIAFSLPPGLPQLVTLGVAMFFVAGTTGPAGAMVARLTPLRVHASAFAVLTLANNFLGLAPGPIAIGQIADRIGLLGALQLLPATCIAASLAFAAIGRRAISETG